MIKGEHDFASFTAKEKYDTTVRTVTYVDFKVNKKQGYSSIIIEATGFLR
jgi:tRNA U38,U39,U40 pseudouridine synthase TruA